MRPSVRLPRTRRATTGRGGGIGLGCSPGYGLQSCGDCPPTAPQTTDSRCQQQGLKVPGKVLDHIERISGPGRSETTR